MLTSPTYGVKRLESDLRHTIEEPSCCGTNESNEVSFVESGGVMGIIRMDQGPRRSLRGFFLTASVADNVPGKAPSTGKPAASSLKGLQRPREELALPERCGVCTHKLLLILSHASYALTLFRFVAQNGVSRVSDRGGHRSVQRKPEKSQCI